MSQKHTPHGSRVLWFRLSIGTVLIILACMATGCVAENIQNNSPISTPTAKNNSAFGTTDKFTDIPRNLRFTKIDADDRLTQSTTNVIIQDGIGFMWFGTEDGLFRYDGNKFDQFTIQPKNSNTLNDQWVTALLPTSNGDLWIGTRLGGLSYFHAKTGSFDIYTHDDKAPDSLRENQVNVITEDQSGRLWVGTKNGLDMLENNTFKHISLGLEEKSVSEIVTITGLVDDKKGFLWVATATKGLFKIDLNSNQINHYTSSSTTQNSLCSNYIRGILPAENGTYWIATSSGLSLFNSVDGSFLCYQHSEDEVNSLSDNRISAMAMDHYGNLWLGTALGLDYLNVKTREYFHYSHDDLDPKSLSNNNIMAIFESKDGVLWISTYGGYINKYYSGMDQFTHYQHSYTDSNTIGGNVVFKISVDQSGLVWVATMGGGVSRIDPITGYIKVFRNDPGNQGSLADDEVWSVYNDSHSILWVGNSISLDRLDPGTKDFIHYPIGMTTSPNSVSGLVYDIAEDRNGNLWFGTSNGVDRYNRLEDSFTHFNYSTGDLKGISDTTITKIYFDRSGTMWLGTFSGGLDRYDFANKRFIWYQNDPKNLKSLSNNSVLAIYQDKKGRIWVGTDGGGLNLLNEEDGSFTHYSKEDGLASNVVYGILEDANNRLWLSTNNGISCFDPYKVKFKNYNETDGLQGNEFNMNAYAQDVAGVMYFGGVNGLTSFNPMKISADPFVPPVVLLTVTQNGKKITPVLNSDQQEQITLRWPDNNLEFEFASLSYVDPNQNQQAYKLESFDQNWVNTGSLREGRYTNLPGGIYQLKLKGSNEDGVWNEIEKPLIVKVIPAFWQTLWFQISAVLLVFGSVFLVYQLRNASAKANTRELERQVGERTKEIERLFEKTKELAVVEERNRLARELHDSAKQKAFAALAQLGTANGVLPDNPKSARMHLQEAENLVYEVIEELTFLIQEMYPLALKEKGLATSIREYIFDWEARTDIQVQVNIEHEKRISLNVEQAIYRSIQESLSNIARHSKATGVKLYIEFSEQYVTAEICDNGCGFDMKTRQNGMGLRTIRERIESIGGSLKIVSEPNCGTCISFRAPLQSPQAHEGDENDESHLNHSGR